MNKISIKKKTDNFVILDKEALNDKNLSWKAKGLHSYLMSLPDDWVLFVSDLENRSSDGRDSTRAAINELLEAGYMERVQKKEKGKFMGYDYSIYEKPKTENPQRENRNGKTVNGLSENGKPDTNKVLNIESIDKINIDTNDKEEMPLTNENDGVPFSGNGMADFLKWKLEKEKTETLNTKKETKEKSSAKKEKKEKPKLKTMIEAYPDEESFVNAWGLRFGAKYPKIDASKGYNRILHYCETKGVLYADYVRVLLVWYTKENEAKRKSYEYDSQPQMSNLEILKQLHENQSGELW